jgi:Tol biopolymer transport system component
VDGAGSVHLDVVCHFAITLGVYVESSGGDPDPDGYVATLNNGSRVGIVGSPLPSGGWLLPPGDYTVTLSDVAPHCRLSGSNTAAATVTSGERASVTFTVSCRAMRTGQFGRDLLVDANTEINLLSADGSRFVNLTDHPDNEFFATWSPDGRKIAFASRFDVIDGPMRSHWESRVFTMNADGTGRTQLTDGYREEGPAWSPDGSRLAFIGTGSDGISHLFVMNADGSGQTPLTSLGPTSTFLSPVPAWSPDGTRIAYSGLLLNRPGIYVISPDGSGETRLTDGYDGAAAWSPDGSRIAFVRLETGQGDVIHVMNADGSGLIRASSATGDALALSWSPDGTKIAFELTGRIYLVNANGTGQAQLTFGQYAYFPIWSPDGSRIAYFQTQEDETRLYLMELDGSGEVPLTPAWALGIPSSPAAWQP